jgi:large repetitive protein
MGIDRMTIRLILAGALVAFSTACGSNDSNSSTGSGPTALYVNEVQSSNKKTIADETGKYPDWIEIYNAGKDTVDLKGYTLADSKNTHVIAGSLPIKAGGYLLLWADKNSALGAAHLSFSLSGTNGDAAIIIDPEGNQVDSATFGASLAADDSYARYPDGTGEFSWCAIPTPGQTNGAACAAQ